MASADDLWGSILSGLDATGVRAALVLNHGNPVVRQILDLTDPALALTATEALHAQSLLASQRTMSPAQSALVNRALSGLMVAALTQPQPLHGAPTTRSSTPTQLQEPA